MSVKSSKPLNESELLAPFWLREVALLRRAPCGGRPVCLGGMFLLFTASMIAACQQGEIAVSDSGQWATTRSVEATAACALTALGNDVTVRTIEQPKHGIEIRSNAVRASAPIYIITITRVETGLTMVQLHDQKEKASRRAKAAAQSCIG